MSTMQDKAALVIGAGVFHLDRNSDAPISSATLRAFAATPGQEQVYTCVSLGSGVRIGVDRDEDGFSDRTELDAGSDPANPASVPVATPTPAATATPTQAPTATAAPTATQTATARPTATQTATARPTATPTPVATATASPTVARTATPVPTATPIPTHTPRRRPH